MNKIALFPGSFDPFTLGHQDIVIRSLDLFDKIIIGIGINDNKKRQFSQEELIPKIKEVFSGNSKVDTLSYTGLTAEFAKEIGAKYIIRGLRNIADFEYEKNICQANKYIWEELETVFLMTTPAFSSLSSTIIRELYRYGKNVDNFLPYKL